MSLDIKNNPKSIFTFLDEEISKVATSIGILSEYNNSKNYESFQKSLDDLTSEINRGLAEFEKNAEWDNFTIAFFGETNAGKSTIIETLRILLNENSKVKQQNKFDEIKNKYNLDKSHLQEIEGELKKIKENLLSLDKEFQEYEVKIKDELEAITQEEENANDRYQEKNHAITCEIDELLQKKNDEIKELEKQIYIKTKTASFFKKIIYFFKKMDEQKEIIKFQSEADYLLSDKKNQLTNLENEHNKFLAELKKKADEIVIRKNSESKEVKKQLRILKDKDSEQQELKKQFDFNLKKLEPYEDGAIVGDGRSDFTKQSLQYKFLLNGTKVNLIDVPGIEGNESSVIKEISDAVKTAHAVIYVTNKDAPPNEGTLKTIKEHLNDQTEVWSLYNKPITNPRQLKKELISNDDERQALTDLNHTLSEALNGAYQQEVVVAGLAALYSVSTRFVPTWSKEVSQQKFLQKFSNLELFEYSKLKDFRELLEKSIIGNVEEKIQKSNFNKANQFLVKVIESLYKQKKLMDLFHEDVLKSVRHSQHEITLSKINFVQNLKNKRGRILTEFSKNVQANVYRKIDENISSDEFKDICNKTIEEEMVKLENSIKETFADSVKEFDEELIRKVDKNLNKITALSKQFFGEVEINNATKSFTLDFSTINNGISIVSLVSVGIGAVVILLNPVGWGLVAIAVAGLFFQAYKAVKSYFSTDFKKAEQRKNIDKNLEKICKNLQKTIEEKIDEIDKGHITKKIDDINSAFGNIEISIKNFSKALTSLINSLNNLSAQIKNYL